MELANAAKQLKRMKIDKNHCGSEYNAITTAIRSLDEWSELQEELGRVAITNRDDLFKLIKRHIERIER